MNVKEKTLWIVHTAVFAALLVVLQAVTAPLGNTILTGTLVNALLVVSVMTCGVMSGASVAVISPIMAKLAGIGPLWGAIPFIAMGNITFILVWHFLGNANQGHKGHQYMPEATALVSAALAKFLVLYIGIVKVAVPLLLGLPEPQATVVSRMFSIPQLITALLGGIVAVPVVRTLKRAMAQYGS